MFKKQKTLNKVSQLQNHNHKFTIFWLDFKEVLQMQTITLQADKNAQG